MKRQVTHTLYLDETGDANLVKINQQYPIFGLGGVIIPVGAERALDDQLSIIKRESFGDAEIVLHSTDLRKARRGFEAMLNPEIRKRFYVGFNKYILDADMTFISVFIKKSEHLKKYKSPYEPYEWGIELILERVAKIMHREGGFCRIVLESRVRKRIRLLRTLLLDTCMLDVGT